MNLTVHQVERIKELLNQGRHNILILTHRNPDGDAIGASLALYNLFLKMGHIVDVLIPNKLPDFLKWMKHADSIHIYSNKQKKSIELIKNATLIFALDFNDISRIDDFKSHVVDSNAYKILIDHHPAPRRSFLNFGSKLTNLSTVFSKESYDSPPEAFS